MVTGIGTASFSEGDASPHGLIDVHGAGEASQVLYGSDKYKRRVYRLAEKGAIPVFKVGGTLCARRSTLLAWVEAQEAKESCNG
ncbi:MAG: hypothetical protein WCO00_17830 [Rhodospirillaceae bacterium]